MNANNYWEYDRESLVKKWENFRENAGSVKSRQRTRGRLEMCVRNYSYIMAYIDKACRPCYSLRLIIIRSNTDHLFPALLATAFLGAALLAGAAFLATLLTAAFLGAALLAGAAFLAAFLGATLDFLTWDLAAALAIDEE